MRLTENQLRNIIRVVIKEAIERPSVFMHVTGNTGCGKTTLMEQLVTDYSQYIFFDLDEFGEMATDELGWDHGWGQKSWTEEKRSSIWKEMTQKVAEDFITLMRTNLSSSLVYTIIQQKVFLILICFLMQNTNFLWTQIRSYVQRESFLEIKKGWKFMMMARFILEAQQLKNLGQSRELISTTPHSYR
jgi:GTPase SAR1 family protein